MPVRPKSLVFALILLLTIGAIGTSTWHYFSPDGTYVLSATIADDVGRSELDRAIRIHPLVDIEPRGRVQGTEKSLSTREVYRRMVGDLVYFRVRTPRQYTGVDVQLQYKNEGQQVVELGIVRQDTWTYDAVPLEVRAIDDAREGHWYATQTDTHELLRSSEVLPTDLEALATYPEPVSAFKYGSVPTIPTILDERTSRSNDTTDATVITTPLRGPHEFGVYVTTGKLSFQTDWTDTNRSEGLDTVAVSLVDPDGTVIESVLEQDDGIVDVPVAAPSTNTQGEIIPIIGTSTHRSSSFSASGLEDGLYRVQLNTSSDVVFTKTTLTSSLVALRNRVDIPEIENFSPLLPAITWPKVSIETDARQVVLTPTHSDGQIDVPFSDGTLLRNLTVNEPARWFNRASPGKRASFTPSESGGFRAEGTGWYFLQGMKPFDLETTHQIENGYSDALTDVLIAPLDYVSPERFPSGRRIATASFAIEQEHLDIPTTTQPLRELHAPERSSDEQELVFVLYAPDISERPEGDLLLDEITFTFTKEPWTLRDVFSKLL